MKKEQIMHEIEHLLTNYCEGCFVRNQLRKDNGKAVAHNFCIHHCSIGEELKRVGKKLI